MLAAALVSTVAVFLILALDLAGYQWLERGIMAFVGVIGLCYGFEVFLVHPDWKLAAFHTLVPTLDPKDLHGSLYVAVGMLGATVMPHVVYLHSALVVIAVGLDPLKILILSQVVLSFALPFALIPLLVLTNRASVMKSFVSARRTRVAGWCAVGIILTLNIVLLGQMALGR